MLTLCANVLTPDRIPEFCIPPRLAPCPALAALRNSGVKNTATDDSAALTDWDPRSQAALSLPHLPLARTAYGFCALLESPHTRRKESLFLGDPEPRCSGNRQLPGQRTAHPALTYGGGGRDAPLQPSGRARATPAAFPRCQRPPRNTLAPRPRGHRLLRSPERLLNRVLRARRSRDPALARSEASGEKDEELGAASGPPAQTLSLSPPVPPGPRPECLEAEGTVTLGRAGDTLRLAAEYSPASGCLRLRLLHPEGPAGGTAESRTVGCHVSLVLPPPGKTRRPCCTVVRRSCRAVFDQDFCFDGLAEDEVRCLAVRVQPENRGGSLQRSRRRGQGELLLGSLLLS